MLKNSAPLKQYLEAASKEDWKYTDLSHYALDAFCPIRNTQTQNLQSQQSAAQKLEDSISSESILNLIRPLLIDPDASQQIIFYNGRFLQGSLRMPASSFSMQPSSQFFSSQTARTKSSHEPDFNNFNDGACLILPKNCVIPSPIYIIQIIQPDTTPLKLQPKNQIFAEADSEASVVELYLTLGEKPSFINSSTEIKLAIGAKLNHLFLQRSISSSLTQASIFPRLNLADIQVEQASHSHYTGTALALDGETNRTAFNIELNGSYAHCQFYALTSACHQQKTDVHLKVQHHKPFSKSTLITRGVIKDKARGAFTGKIVVKEDAIGTQAFLENKNLLLSSEAEAATRPQLEVYNQDVQCSHGATVGYLDENALFYLQSRGIPEREAKQLLIDSFIEPSLQGLSPALKTYISGLFHGY